MLKKIPRHFIYLSIILIVAAILRFWQLDQFGLQSDATLYSFRALGWLDFLVGENQTSPIVWFGHIPWWANLSFHDVPPLGLFIQHLFFLALGETVLAALLPFAISGVFVTAVVYYIGKNINYDIAALSAGIIAILSPAVWISRTGYLEGIELVFICLCILFFIKYILQNKNHHLLLWGLFGALALLTKYTAIFLVPVSILGFIAWKREVFKNKFFWLAILLGIVVLLPVIIYNVMVFKTRGHFDAALSSMVGMHPEDFATISERGVNSNILANFISIFSSLSQIISLPAAILLFIAFVFWMINMLRKKNSWLVNFILLNIIFIFLMFSFSGADPRFVSICIPFLVLLLTFFLHRLWHNYKGKLLAVPMLLLVCLIGVFEIFYTINTNILHQPVGQPGVFFAVNRFYALGFNELDKYLHQNIINPQAKKIKIENYSDILEYTISQDHIALVDERLDWFSKIWYVNKYLIYKQIPVFPIGDVSAALKNDEIDTKAVLNYFISIGIREYYYIYVTPSGRLSDQGDTYSDQMELLHAQLEASGAVPDKEISNYKGEVVFKIYHFSLE